MNKSSWNQLELHCKLYKHSSPDCRTDVPSHDRQSDMLNILKETT